jgi:hypothetical protein
MLFEEFNSVCQRNAVSKTKSHPLFGQFYSEMIEPSLEKGFMTTTLSSCERTGWPIDITLEARGASKQDQTHAIYFLL